MVAVYVVSCLWLHAVRRNSERLEPGVRHARSVVWVWLGWWVPVVSVWFPYQVVRDVRYASGRRTGGLALWWTCWLVYIIGNRVTANLSSSRSVEAVEALPVVEAVVAAVMLVGLVRWIGIVRTITADQERWLSTYPEAVTR